MKEKEKLSSFATGLFGFFFHFFTKVCLSLAVVHIWLSTGEFLIIAAYITEIPLASGRTAVLGQCRS